MASEFDKNDGYQIIDKKTYRNLKVQLNQLDKKLKEMQIQYEIDMKNSKVDCDKVREESLASKHIYEDKINIIWKLVNEFITGLKDIYEEIQYSEKEWPKVFISKL